MAQNSITLEQAAARLERAVAALEGRLKARALEARASDLDGDLFGEAIADAEVKLAAAHARQAELELAAAEASAALGRAAAEIRTVLADAEAEED
jgi:hypothetical protein